jgi:hypothetical protein
MLLSLFVFLENLSRFLSPKFDEQGHRKLARKFGGRLSEERKIPTGPSSVDAVTIL